MEQHSPESKTSAPDSFDFSMHAFPALDTEAKNQLQNQRVETENINIHDFVILANERKCTNNEIIKPH